jgi:hypothetical protein
VPTCSLTARSGSATASRRWRRVTRRPHLYSPTFRYDASLLKNSFVPDSGSRFAIKNAPFSGAFPEPSPRPSAGPTTPILSTEPVGFSEVSRTLDSLSTIRCVESLILKLVVTPLLIGAASLAGHRWGAAVGGWLVGIPFTSGPIAFFLALDHGASFAASASVGMLVGTISQALFCLAYAWASTRLRWPASFGAGTLGFAATTVVLRPLEAPASTAFEVTVAALVVALLLIPRDSSKLKVPEQEQEEEAPPRWDLPARMVVATVFVLLLTAIAPLLGPYLSGLLSPFPLFGAILTVFTHRSQGSIAATRLLRGLLYGLFAPAGFFLALAILIERVGIGLSFGAATATALAFQGVTLWLLSVRLSGCSSGIPTHLPRG